jgi:hypothetical protein
MKSLFKLSLKSKPKTTLEKNILNFLSKYDFVECLVEEDGELIMVDFKNEQFSIREFVNGSKTSRDWNKLQKAYDKSIK